MSHHRFPPIHRLVDLPADMAQEAFNLVVYQDGSEALRLVSSSGRLDLDGAGIVFPATATYTPFRRVEGRLRRAGSRRRGLPVKLELLAWSDRRSELLLSPARRYGPLAARHGRRYRQTVHEILEALGSAMENWPEALMRA